MSLAPSDIASILIVDDAEGARESLADLLTGAGYSCAEAVDGRGALMFLRRAQETGTVPQLILLDVEMPVSAWAFREEQVQDPALARIPVVVISGVYQLASAAQSLEAVDCVAKPIDTDRLFAIVRQQCGRRSSPPSERRPLKVDPPSGRVARHPAADPPRGDAPPPPYSAVPVTVRCGNNSVVGYAESLTATEVVVQALEELPGLEGACEVVIDFPAGSATARGKLIALDRGGGLLRISLERVEGGGSLLLAAAITAEATGEGEASPR
jgi:CheY-like chemotaxis protein